MKHIAPCVPGFVAMIAASVFLTSCCSVPSVRADKCMSTKYVWGGHADWLTQSKTNPGGTISKWLELRAWVIDLSENKEYKAVEIKNEDGKIHLQLRTAFGPFTGLAVRRSMHGLSQSLAWAKLRGVNSPEYVTTKRMHDSFTELYAYRMKQGVQMRCATEATFYDKVARVHHAARGGLLIVSGGFRHPAVQAEELIELMEEGRDLSKIYLNTAAAIEIQRDYEWAKKAGLSKRKLFSRVVNLIRAQMRRKSYISPHLRGTAVDVSNRGLSQADGNALVQLLAQLKQAESVRFQDKRKKARDPHIHVEFLKVAKRASK